MSLAHVETLKITAAGLTFVPHEPHVGREPRVCHDLLFLNVIYGRVRPSPGGGGSVKTCLDNLSPCFSLSNPKPRLLQSYKITATVEPFLTFISVWVGLLNPPSRPPHWGMSIPPAALNTPSCLCLSTLALLAHKHAQRHMPGVCTYPGRDADKQLNR